MVLILISNVYICLIWFPLHFVACASHTLVVLKKISDFFFLNNLECIPVWPITGCVAQASFRLSILLH